jgi:hypothetical protein
VVRTKAARIFAHRKLLTRSFATFKGAGFVREICHGLANGSE